MRLAHLVGATDTSAQPLCVTFVGLPAPVTVISRAIDKGVPPEVVMKWTGHSDYKAMKPYIAIANSTKAQEMTKFDE